MDGLGLGHMVGYQFIKSTRKYLAYIEDHLSNVARAFNEVCEKCKDFAVIYDDHLFWQLRREVLFHDVSKFSDEEFMPYRREFYKIEEYEEQNGKSFKSACRHHKEHNLHHWENWTQLDGQKDVHIMHMIIDWLAMSYDGGKSPRSYLESEGNKMRMSLGDMQYILDVLNALDGQGNEILKIK